MHWPICTKENVIVIRFKAVWSSVSFWRWFGPQPHVFLFYPPLACSTQQHWQTHQYVKSKLHGWIITLPLPLPPPSPRSNHTDFKCHAELLRCYTVTVQVWILGYKSPELCRPTKPEPESPAAVCGFVCYRRRGRKTVREGKKLN